MDFFEVATSTPTMRRFLDWPIPEADLIKILETANMAPSGSNAQPWEFVVVRAANARREIQKLYESVWGPYKDSAIIRGRTLLSPRAVKALKTGDEFAAQLAMADLFNFGATYGSIFPAIELMMLAARALGVGTAMTTMLTSKESETKALLGVPAEYQLIALVPMGYPADGFKRPMRKPVFARIHDERWDRAWPHSASLPRSSGEG